MASFLALYLRAVLRVGRKDVSSPKERESEGEAKRKPESLPTGCRGRGRPDVER